MRSAIMTIANAESLTLTRVPIAEPDAHPKASRRCVEAIVNPDVTTNFWFTKSSGRLEVGKRVQWDCDVYNHSAQVTPKAIEPNARIVIEWPAYSGPTTVEWTFAPRKNGATFVSVTESGFKGSGDELVKYVAESTQEFPLMLAGLKAFLEHAVRLNRYTSHVRISMLPPASWVER